MKKLIAKESGIFASVLFRNMALLFLLIFFPVAMITRISVSMSSENMIKHVVEKENQLLRTQKEIVESTLTVAEYLSQQIIFDADVMNYLYSSTSNTDYLTIKRIMQLLEEITYSNELIESIYFFDKQHDYVISDQLFRKDVFPDSFALAPGFAGGASLKAPRILDRSTAYTVMKPVYITSYCKSISNAINYNDITVVINLKTEMVYSGLTGSNVQGAFHIADTAFKTLFSSDAKPGEPLDVIDPALTEAIQGTQVYSDILSVHDETLFVSAIASERFNLYYLTIQNYDEFSNSVSELSRKLILSFALILALSLGLVAVCSYYLYRPISKLLGKISGYGIPGMDREKNEYVMIDKTMSHLYEHNITLQEKYQVSYSYLEAYSIHEFLINPHFDQAAFDKLLQTMGMHFRHPFYMIVLFEFNDTDEPVSLRKLLKLLYTMPEQMECLASTTKKDSIASVINTTLSRAQVIGVLEQICDECRQQGRHIVVGAGECFDDIRHLPIYYNEALVQVKQKFFAAWGQVLDLAVAAQRPLEVSYEELQDRLISTIKALDYEKTEEILEQLVNEYLNQRSNSVEHVKFLVFHLASQICHHVIALGATYSRMELDDSKLFKMVSQATHMEEMRLLLYELIGESLYVLHSLSRQRYSELINQTLHFINQNYTRDISLSDIAENVHLSPNYLSKIFKEEKGDTIFEVITTLRMEHAAKLLTTTDTQVKIVSEQVGYNNVQSFIRYFKKHFSLTPEQYRKMKNIEKQ